MTDKKNRYYYFYVFAALLILLDQFTKLLFKDIFGIANIFGLQNLDAIASGRIPVIGDFLQFVYVENEGMAFGITFGVFKILLSLFSVAASIALAYLIYKIKDSHFAVKLGFSLILAGAAGNLIDRCFYGVLFNEGPLFYGRVVDFIQLDIPDISFLGLNYSHFPVFNVADSCVTCGAALLILFHKKIPHISFSKSNVQTEIVPNSTESNNIQ